jgi:hypothetical protein
MAQAGSTITDILDEFRTAATDARDKGDRFERLTGSDPRHVQAAGCATCGWPVHTDDAEVKADHRLDR